MRMSRTNKVPLDATLMPTAAAIAIDKQQTHLAAVRDFLTLLSFIRIRARARALLRSRRHVHPSLAAARHRVGRRNVTAEGFENMHVSRSIGA